MTTGLLSRFPDLSSLTEQRDNADGSASGLLGALGSLESGDGSSPLATVTSAIGDLGEKLDIDMDGLTDRLPSAIDTVRNAMPPDTLEFVETIEDAYTAAQDFLDNSALVKAIPEGASIQDTAMAVIQDAINLLNGRLANIGDGLIDAETLQKVRDALDTIQQFQSNFPSDPADFLPFITDNLVGLAPDLLDQPLNHINNARSTLLDPISTGSLASTVEPARQVIANAFGELVTIVDNLDPADTSAYVEIQTRLDTVENALNPLFDTLEALYGQMDGVIANPIWDDVMSTYQMLLEAITIEPPFTMDDVIDEIAGAIEDILAKFYTMFGVEDITERIESLNTSIQETFASSPLGEIRQTLLDFLEQIREAIESIPTEVIQQTIEEMLGRVKQELDSLGITQIADQIEQAFQEAETFVIDNINQALGNDVQGAMNDLFAQVQNLGISDLIGQLTSAMEQLDTLIAEVDAALQGHLDTLTDLASRLDELSFEPLSDKVIEEIDEIKGRLEEINPNSLSDVEKLAIKGALALLEAIDLQEQVVNGLKEGFHLAEDEVKKLLNQLTAILQRLRDNMGDFSPEQVLGPLSDIMDEGVGFLDRLNGRALLSPAYDQVDNFIEQLEDLSPGRILDPLQEPYDQMMEFVNRLNPDQLIAPLNSLYSEIDRLISIVDITPIFDELDRQQRELFNTIRDNVIAALDSINLPEPLATFFNEIRPVLEGLTDALLGDPDEELKRISIDMRSRLKLSSLFTPLDMAFDRLVAMIEAAPQDTLTDVMNGIREGVGVGLDVLDPRTLMTQLRAGQQQLSELNPAHMLSMPLALPSLKLAFEAKAALAPPGQQGDVATVSARFEAVFTLVSSGQVNSRMEQLGQTHDNLVDSLRQRINSLDTGGVSQAYSNLNSSIDRLLPDFLRQPEPLTHQDIIAGINTMRPSTKASKIDEVLDRFLQRIEPLEDALEPVINNFFSGIREMVSLINPLVLRDAVASIYDTVREKVRILDPSALADSIRTNIFEPLLAPLDAINPTAIKNRLNAAFNRVLDAISTNIKALLDSIVAVIDDQLRLIRDEIRGLVDQIKSTVESSLERLENILNRIEQLIFKELLERLVRVVTNLGISFDKELDRVSNSFSGMLAAIPV